MPVAKVDDIFVKNIIQNYPSVNWSTKTNEDILQRENKNLKAENATPREDVTRLAHRLSLEAKVTGGTVLDRSPERLAQNDTSFNTTFSIFKSTTQRLSISTLYQYYCQNNKDFIERR